MRAADIEGPWDEGIIPGNFCNILSAKAYILALADGLRAALMSQ